MLTKKGTAIAFTFSDPLVLFFAGGVLITYKWNLNPEPKANICRPVGYSMVSATICIDSIPGI